jgi:hypothetical protein
MRAAWGDGSMVGAADLSSGHGQEPFRSSPVCRFPCVTQGFGIRTEYLEAWFGGGRGGVGGEQKWRQTLWTGGTREGRRRRAEDRDSNRPEVWLTVRKRAASRAARTRRETAVLGMSRLPAMGTAPTLDRGADTDSTGIITSDGGKMPASRLRDVSVCFSRVYGGGWGGPIGA